MNICDHDKLGQFEVAFIVICDHDKLGQVVVAMDKERSSLGRLGYSEFKDLIVSLKMWQVISMLLFLLFCSFTFVLMSTFLFCCCIYLLDH